MCPPLSQATGSVQNCTPPRRYLCCETQMELREWFATFLFVQVPGAGCRVQGSGVGWGPKEAPIVVNGTLASSLFRPPIASRRLSFY